MSPFAELALELSTPCLVTLRKSPPSLSRRPRSAIPHPYPSRRLPVVHSSTRSDPISYLLGTFRSSSKGRSFIVRGACRDRALPPHGNPVG